ncbi:MAG: hypothetical protein GF419_01590 [Ignavibacteriales bacterium]|nr:hypothetical protein [Ignavibacteriales bacterium]
MPDEKAILLHVCCAPCAAPSGERLMDAGDDPTLFFSNSNIAPKAEYDKRLAHAKKLAAIWGVRLIEDEYDHEAWRETVRGYEDGPERGERCRRCFAFSLARANRMAEELGVARFTTTLTLSSHKVSRMVFEAGARHERYEPHNFKKKNGERRSRELCDLYDLYRQDYCGCEFSLRDRERAARARAESVGAE